MATKGLSYEEKRKRMLEYFHEEKAVFNLKELENDLRKAKGIVQQSVKDVLQSLTDDSLVQQDKIGSGNFFWSFPSQDTRARKLLISKARASLEGIERQREELGKRKRQLAEDRPDTEEYKKKIQKLAQIRQEDQEAEARLLQFSEDDPERPERLRRMAAHAKEAANRETNNIFILKSWAQEKNSEIKDADFYAQFGLPKDMDELE